MQSPPAFSRFIGSVLQIARMMLRFEFSATVKPDRRSKPDADLWGELLEFCEYHDVEFVWVRGHSGVPENERCDTLSVQAAKRKNLPQDTGYETG